MHRCHVTVTWNRLKLESFNWQTSWVIANYSLAFSVSVVTFSCCWMSQFWLATTLENVCVCLPLGNSESVWLCNAILAFRSWPLWNASKLLLTLTNEAALCPCCFSLSAELPQLNLATVIKYTFSFGARECSAGKMCIWWQSIEDNFLRSNLIRFVCVWQRYLAETSERCCGPQHGLSILLRHVQLDKRQAGAWRVTTCTVVP